MLVAFIVLFCCGGDVVVIVMVWCVEEQESKKKKGGFGGSEAPPDQKKTMLTNSVGILVMLVFFLCLFWMCNCHRQARPNFAHPTPNSELCLLPGKPHQPVL